jgi:acetyl-CoA carboxylase carboxyltransferase component
VARQRAADKLTVRERIERLLDACSFHETGGLAGVGRYGDAGYAWPSGDRGSLPIAGGLEAAYRRDLEAADDPVALRAKIEERPNGSAPRSGRPSASA